MTERMLVEGLITESDPPHLVGGKPRDGGPIVFPYPEGSEAAHFEPVALSRTGTLWSYTVQRFRPKSPPFGGPEAFEPFALGYVELPGEVIVESRLTGIPFEDLRIGMDLELDLVPFRVDPDGTVRMIYAFGPVGGGV
jgi:uncharacterized OB-fold protein